MDGQTRVPAAVALCVAVSTLALPARRADPAARPPGVVSVGLHPGAHRGARPVRVGLVFDVGGRGDKSFNDGAYAGLVRARAELGAEVEYVEPSDSDDREAALRLFAARGFDRVIGIGYIFSRDVDTVARDYPAVSFACVDYAPPDVHGIPPNVVGLKFREDEGSFLVGAVAGLYSHTGAVGFVGGMDIPLIRRFERGYTAGVREVCPACRVLSAYAGSTPSAFKDPEKGELLATSQYAQGVDVIFHASGSTGHGVFVAAHRLRRHAIGVDADQYEEMPDVVITSMLKRVDVVVFDVVRDATEGRLDRGHGGLRTFGLADGGIDYVHTGPHAAGLPLALVTRVEALRGRLARGELSVPGE